MKWWWPPAGALVILGLYWGASALTKPECPDGAVRKLTRDGWYCTVKPLM